MFFGLLDRAGHLEFINAGHPSPLLLRAGEVLEPFAEGNLPVGLTPSTEYVAASFNLQPADVLVMFSDGVTEASNIEEDMFGISRLCEQFVTTTPHRSNIFTKRSSPPWMPSPPALNRATTSPSSSPATAPPRERGTAALDCDSLDGAFH